MNQNIVVNGLSVLLLRILLSGIFINVGISHLLYTDKVSNRIQNAPNAAFAQLFGNPELLGILSGSVLLISGIAFLLGVFTRWSALVLFLVLIPITITIQVGNGWLHGPFWKNVALFGGLLFFIINNPKEYTLYNPSSLTS